MTFSEWLATCEATLELHSTAILRQEQTGAHRSAHTGRGLRLRYHEAYRPGDERRCIDWKISRREPIPLLRRFEAEKRLDVVAVCDVSASMGFGRHLPKHSIALDCAGILGLAALHRGDAFGLLAFTAETVAHFPPRQRREAVLQALEYLWGVDPLHATHTTTLLSQVLQHLPVQRPLLLCILSDFRMPDWQKTLDVLSASHDTIAVLIEDEAEASLGALGSIMVHDLESGRVMELDTASTAYRRAYHQHMLDEQAAREQVLQRSCGPQYVIARHNTDYQGDLLRLFLARTARAWI
jgi:uncharacterized protein (DUF58 family)